jgi:hypothetical protein
LAWVSFEKPVNCGVRSTIIVLILSNYFCSPSPGKNRQEDHPSKNNLEYYPANKSPLESKIKTVDLTYIAWGCECANWIEANAYDKFEDENKLAENSIFLESGDSSLKLPDTLGYSGDIIKFTGEFYTEKGYPGNYPISEQHPAPARVFRYTSYKVVRSNYRDFVANKN